MDICERRERRYPRRLPTVCFDGVEYFVDERLHEFREVHNPHQRVEFDSEAGAAMVEAFYTIDCPHCGQELCVFWWTLKDSIVCTGCGKDVPLTTLTRE